MKTWKAFTAEEPDLAGLGQRLFIRTRANLGLAFLATLRKDGAPRLHPVSPLFFQDRLYLFISSTSPKCADLKRDGRFAMQASPPPENEANEEFYLSGAAEWISDQTERCALIEDLGIRVGQDQVLFELFLERAMYTRLVDLDTPDEHPVHLKWRATT